MWHFTISRWIKCTALVIVASASSCVIGAETAGSVSFVIGEAGVLDADSKSVALARGGVIMSGQTLVTGATGHIHLRMVDGAFVSVRPQSTMRIEEYHYDAATPANSRIKFVLEKGVARSITGRAGQAAKENYRLNTPLAAIGIRGTDFVVQAGSDITRVTVQSGAVVMTPFGNECLVNTLGPCKSASSRVLTAAMRNAYLELRSRGEAPLLVPAEKALDSPNHVAPPRPEEPRPVDKQIKGAASGDAQDAVREAATDQLKKQVNATSAPAFTPAPAGGSAPIAVVVVVLPPPPSIVPPSVPQFWWGRWSNFVQPGQEERSLVAALRADREIAVGNDVFGLVRQIGDTTMPNSGIAKFQLADSEAYVMKDRKTLIPAQVSAASLTVDFGAKRFDTALIVSSVDLAPVPVQASGRVTFQGQLFSDTNTTGTVVNGALSRDASQAGTVFQRDLSSSLGVLGVVRWVH